MLKRSLRVLFIVVGCCSVHARPAYAQEFMMSVFTYMSWDGAVVNGYAQEWDNNNGLCVHSNPTITVALTSPSSRAAEESTSGGSVSVALAFDDDDGTWQVSGVFTTFCTCAMSDVGADGAQQQELQRVPTSLVDVDAYYGDAPPVPYELTVWRRVLDQFGAPLTNYPSGLYINETYDPQPPVGNCHSTTVTTGSGFAYADGTFSDSYFLTGGPTPCSSTSTQHIYVNGREVKVQTVQWTDDGMYFP